MTAWFLSAVSRKWGAWALFLLGATSMGAPLLYFLDTAREPFGPYAYEVADVLFGPVWAASLIAGVLALRERLGDSAPRQMTVALLAATVSGAFMVAAAIARSTNRDYLEHYSDMAAHVADTIFRAWSTVVPALVSSGYHFLGWALVLVAWASWRSGGSPRALSGLCLVAGLFSVAAYTTPDGGATVRLLLAMWAIWQGAVLWRPEAAADGLTPGGSSP